MCEWLDLYSRFILVHLCSVLYAGCVVLLVLAHAFLARCDVEVQKRTCVARGTWRIAVLNVCLLRSTNMPRDAKGYLLKKKSDATDEDVALQWSEIEDLYTKRCVLGVLCVCVGILSIRVCKT